MKYIITLLVLSMLTHSINAQSYIFKEGVSAFMCNVDYYTKNDNKTFSVSPSYTYNGKITAKVIDTALARVREIAKQPNTFYTDQFKRRWNCRRNSLLI